MTDDRVEYVEGQLPLPFEELEDEDVEVPALGRVPQLGAATLIVTNYLRSTP